MGTPTTLCQGLILCLLLTCQLSSVTQASKVWGEVPLPEDLESEKDVQASRSLLDDDEDFVADGASGELPSGEEDGSTPEPETTIYFRAFVNFTNSLVFSPALQDPSSTQFEEISEAVMDTLESEYNKIQGVQSVSVVHIKKVTREDGVDVFVELDVGTNYDNEELIRSVLYNVVEDGSIASYVTSVRGFQFRRLGKVVPIIRPCMANEFRCGDGTCIPLNYKCDNRADCRDLSDEETCGFIAPVYTTPAPITVPPMKVLPPAPPLRCRADQATCQSGECISRDYICDGERDCADGSDEFRCGTPSPCEPNEFRCKNGRCALKLWRCDGDNDCEDNSDEMDCPTKGPEEQCASKHFECVSDRKCIPASYQCDEEPDCADRSDEYGCTPPTVTTPPEESIQAVRGSTVMFTCRAVGVPTPMITWRLNWGHIPVSGRVSMNNKNGFGTLTIRDVKESDQGAYTCEAINAKGLVFGVPDGVLTLVSNPIPGNCPDGTFSVNDRCVPCFCAGISKNCKSAGRYRDQIRLRFTDEEDFKGVNVSYPSRPSTPPLSSTQLLIKPEMEEFQLVDLSRRFLNLDSFWTLPRQFLGNKIDSYGGTLKFKVRYTLARGLSESVERPDVILVGNGRRLVYRRGHSTPANVVNQKEIRFTEDSWQHSNGQPVSRGELMMTLANLDSISIRTIYDNHMVSVALSDIVMETTTTEFISLGPARDVEECRCPAGYTGLSCEICSSGFERVPGGLYLGTCAGCNCNGHATDCDPISGNCLSCQHNTEGPQCEKCRPGYFGDPGRGRPDDCKPCPCPYPETSRRFSDTCFLDIDQQATCDACRPGYTGRRCEKCAPGYQGNPLLPNGKCVSQSSKCDNRGTVSSSSRPCSCKNNVAGASCDECKPGFFHLSQANPEGCLSCFCMGVSKTCASSTWRRDQVRGGVNGQLFSLSNRANTNTISEGISQRGPSEIVYRFFTSLPDDIYYWNLPESFRGDEVTAYGGELHYTVRFEPFQRSQSVDNQPDVVLQGNDILLEYYHPIKLIPRVAQTVTVTFRESAWRRSDGQPCTREHLLMALADVDVFMIRATYADNLAESSISDVRMDIAVPHSTGNEVALEVEECACPLGYRGPSCQECEVGYSRTRSGIYLGTCERCDCNGHSTSCDPETGRCLQCLHNTDGQRCERCQNGYYGNPLTGDPQACQPCPCPGTTPANQFSSTCYMHSDGQPTCDNCPPGFTGRRCEREEKLPGDKCEDPIPAKNKGAFPPVGCGAEPVFNFSWEMEAVSSGSEEDDGAEDEDVDYVTSFSTESMIVVPTRAPLSTASPRPMTSSAEAERENVSPSFTPSTETRPSSFQRSLQVLLKNFNQRLSMIESHTLHMKKSIHNMEEQQIHLNSKLQELIRIRSIKEKDKEMVELQKSYTDMDSRLNRLEERLEILIDGFTALAQEMNKIKKVRHIGRSAQEKRPLSLVTTILAVTLCPSTHSPIRVPPTATPLQRRATVPQSIPTPGLPTNKPNHTSKKKQPSVTKKRLETPKPQTVTRLSKNRGGLRPGVQPNSTQKKTKPVSHTTAKPNRKKTDSQKPSMTDKRPSASKRKETKQKPGATRFQLEPPSHRPVPSLNLQLHEQPEQADGSDAPFLEKKPLKKQSKPQRGNSEQNRKRSKDSAKNTSAAGKPTRTAVGKKEKTITRKTSAKVKVKSSAGVKMTPTSRKAKATNAKESTNKSHPKNKSESNADATDLLNLLNRLNKPARQRKKMTDTLHILLGRLAIPIEIIPDY